MEIALERPILGMGIAQVEVEITKINSGKNLEAT